MVVIMKDNKKILQENILNFWIKNAIDKVNGGIYTQLDKEGNIYGTEKSVWFQGRALWSIMKTYNFIEKKPEYLEIAENIYKFLPECTDKDGRMFFTVTEDGREIQKRRYYYSETFAAIGCAELYKATGREDVIKSAEKYFDTAYGVFSGEISTTPKFNPENAAYKALAPVMIMLSTAQVLRSTGVNFDKYNKICQDCVHEIINGGYFKKDLGGILENVGPDGEFVDTPTGRIANPGHGLEAAWFVMCEGIISGNEEAKKFGLELTDAQMALGWDKEHGGIISFTDILGKPAVQLEWDMKLWWPQCEALIANKVAYEISGDERYLDNSNKLCEYIKKYFIDEKDGEWYGYLHYDNTVANTLKGNIFKGPFHIPRLYLILAGYEENGTIKDYLK